DLNDGMADVEPFVSDEPAQAQFVADGATAQTDDLFEGAATGFLDEAESDLGGDLTAESSDEPAADADSHAGVFASSMESYDQEFTTPSEQFESDADVAGWSGSDLSDMGSAPAVQGDSPGDDGGALPDLWASEGKGAVADGLAAAVEDVEQAPLGDPADDVQDLEQAE